MKHLTLSILFLLISHCGLSQNYIPLPDSAARWRNEYSLVNPFPVNHCEFHSANYYCLNGEDTLINSIDYTKLRLCNSGDYQGAIRNDSGKVFFVPKDSITAFILYDFTAQEGDTIYDVYWQEFLSEAAHIEDVFVQYPVDSVMIQGAYRNKLTVSFVNFGGLASWVEGIGNYDGLLLGTGDNISGYCQELSCMSHKDSTLYPNESTQPCALDLSFEETELENKISVSPNPTKTGIITINCEHITNINYAVFNSTGQSIKMGKLNSSQLHITNKPGIYFLHLYSAEGNVVKKVVVE